MNTKSLIVCAIMLLSGTLSAQHRVSVTTPAGQTLSISGDSTKFSFKATIAKYEGKYKDAAKFMVLSVESGQATDIGSAYYNAACYYSLAEDKSNGFMYLKKGIDSGYNDIGNMLFDKDLEYLRQDDGWKKEMNAYTKKYFKDNNEELAMMFGEDQAVRLSGKPIDWEVVAPQDEVRRKRVLELLESGKVHSADDYYKAAFIMHHGTDSVAYLKSHELALIAIGFGDNKHKMAPWLAAASKDRYLLSINKPQWFGTQDMEFLQETKKMGMNPAKIDTTAVTPEQRLEWNAPPIERIRTYLKNYQEAKKDKH